MRAPRSRRLALPILAALLVLPALVRAADLPWPLVFTDRDAVLLLPAGAAKARKIGQGRSPSLDPDGKRAVWIEHGNDPATARLVLCDLATGGVTVLAKPGGYLQSPCFIEGGRAVVFVRRGPDAGQELWLVRPGTSPVRLARTGGAAGNDFFEPMWFPADGAIGYNDMHTLYLRKPDGAPLRSLPLARLAPEHANQFTSTDRMAASPDGGRLVFSRSVPGTPLFQKKVTDSSSALFLYDTRTGKTERLTPANLTAFAPAWTPDGQAVVFTGYTDAQAGERFPFRVWVIRPGGAPAFVCRGEDAMPPAPR